MKKNEIFLNGKLNLIRCCTKIARADLGGVAVVLKKFLSGDLGKNESGLNNKIRGGCLVAIYDDLVVRATICEVSDGFHIDRLNVARRNEIKSQSQRI